MACEERPRLQLGFDHGAKRERLTVMRPLRKPAEELTSLSMLGNMSRNWRRPRMTLEVGEVS
jgi:hypothetical protein